MANRSETFRRAQKRFRANRFREIERIIRKILISQDTVRVLDVGGTGSYWHLLPEDLRKYVSITCINFKSELELYQSEIQELSISYVEGNGCYMPEFDREEFDLVHSNSVIEHVGSYRNMMDFSSEIARVGRSFYVQTPCFSFPIDPHYARPFIHWLPDPIRIWFFQNFSFGYSKKKSFVDSMKTADATKIISIGMMSRLFPDAVIRKERFLFLTKSIMAVREK